MRHGMFSARDVQKLLEGMPNPFTDKEIDELLRKAGDSGDKEECLHPETECGHCIDCGKYFNPLAEAFND